MPRRQVTSRDVARRAGVSRTTVSFVLNNVPGVKISDDTRQRVLQATRVLGYHPTAAARSLASGRTQRIGLVLGEGQRRLAGDAFIPQFLRGITASIARRGYLLVLQMAEDVPTRAAYDRLLREQQVDGLILSGPRLDDPLLPELAAEGFPLILHGRMDGSQTPFVDVDNRSGARQATAHLAGLGHRRIGFVSNAPMFYSGAQERLAGYREALVDHGLPVDESLVRTSGFSPDSGAAAMRELLKTPHPPTAVFAASDVTALGVLGAIHQAGLRVPQDVALVGFDDIFLAAHAVPPLTTVRVPAYGLGWTAAELLIALIEGDEDIASITLETEFVVRDSCGARRASPPACGPAAAAAEGALPLAPTRAVEERG